MTLPRVFIDMWYNVKQKEKTYLDYLDDNNLYIYMYEILK